MEIAAVVLASFRWSGESQSVEQPEFERVYGVVRVKGGEGIIVYSCDCCISPVGGDKC